MKYIFEGATLLLLLCINLIQPVQAQQTAKIFGFIRDAETSETLLQANIIIKGTLTGTSSNNSGYYVLSNLPTGEITIQASYVGFQTLDIPLVLKPGEEKRVDINLKADSNELEEVVVTSDRLEEEKKNIGTLQIKTDLIKSVPAILEADVFRSIQLMPGVKAASDYSSALYIRGGGPDQTLILLDRTTVYNPTHFFGFFSTFNPDAIKDIQLYKGGYNANYGGRLGSVLDIYNKDGNRKENKGGVTVGMLASRVFAEGPYKKGSWMFALRRSTLEPLLYALRGTSDAIPESFYFYDVNGKINYDINENNRINFAFYGGVDNVRVPFSTDAKVLLQYGNQTGSFNWNHLFNANTFGNLTLTGSRYFSFPKFFLAGTEFVRSNNIFDFSLKYDLDYTYSDHHSIRWGLWGGNMVLKLKDKFDNQETFNSRLHTGYASTYITHTWRPDDSWKFDSGLRLNYHTNGNFYRLDPRLAIERTYERVRLQASVGGYSQFLTLISNEAFSGFDTWLITANGVSPAYGWQYGLGAKTRIFEGFNFDIEGYYRTMENLFELDPTLPDPAGKNYDEIFRFGRGFAYGVELLLEKTTGKFNGFLGYTWGITRRKFPNVNNNQYYSPKYDRTHDVNLVLNYQLSKRWKITSVFNYATGQAYTLPIGRTQTYLNPFSTVQSNYFDIGTVNGARLPSYTRMDIGFTRTGTFFGGKSELQLQIINILNNKNIWFYLYDFDSNPVKRTEVPLLPILPTISYSVNF
ncbi:TonB-dependent receptor [bacterium]|nr:MAG: TonB-dependent receptor [bacterium]